MKIALVTDWIYGGGSELVVESFHRLYPEAPIYTSYCSDEWCKRLDNKVVTGYLQHPPFKQLRKFLPLLRQWWFAALDLSDFDLVISITGNGEAKFVKVPNGTHISYCHTPVHFYWRHYKGYLAQPGFRPVWMARLGLKALVGPLRRRDYGAAQKIDHFIANSSHIQADIKKYYGRTSTVIFPPVHTERFSKSLNIQKRNGFVAWGRHVPMKRLDIAIEACNQLGLPLTIAGSGPITDDLKKLAGPTIRFLGRVSDDKLVQLAQSAEGFLFPSIEDFGIAPVEALAAGTPVIAYHAGGAFDYIEAGKTGLFFDQQSAVSLVKTLRTFKAANFNNKHIADYAQRFSDQNFKTHISNFVVKNT